MVDTLGPADAVAGAPSFSGRKQRQLNSSKLAGATAARPLGARSGVRPGTSVTTVTATSGTWTCQAFGGVADVMTAAEAGPYDFAFDAVATGPMTPAHATLARKDIIYVSVADPAESVGATPSVTRKYLAGTANAAPVAPAVPIAERGFVIAEINVPASGGGSPTVTWVAPYMAAAGGVVQFNTKAQLDAWTPADDGLYLREGGAWLQIGGTGGWTNLTLAAGWTTQAGFGVPQARTINGKRELRGTARFNATIPASTTLMVAIGSAPAPIASETDNNAVWVIATSSAGTILFLNPRADGGIRILSNVVGGAGTDYAHLDGLSY